MHTPNLDRLASRGILLERMYSTSPVCMPQRITLTTGRYGMNTGCYGNGHALPDPKCPNFVRNLRNGGVTTALIGKFHNHQHYQNADFIAHESEIHELGYEHVCETSGKVNVGHHQIRCRFTEFLQAEGIYEDYRPWAKEELEGYHPNMPSAPWKWDPETTQDAFIAKRAVEFIERVPDSQPFYLHLGFVGPHPPFDAPERYRECYRDTTPPPEAGGDSAPRNPGWWRAYCACITEVDALIGKVVNALKSRGRNENTIIFYTSDHGDYAGDLGQWSKGDFHEPSVHVPFIASGPGIAVNRRTAALAELIDVGATVCDLLGIPSHRLDQGLSLKPVITGDSNHHRDDCYSEMEKRKMIFDGRYKLMFGSNKSPVPDDWPPDLVAAGAPVFLYDLIEDPREERNLSTDPRYRGELDELKERLLRRIIENQQALPSSLEGKRFLSTRKV